ncbi:MAG: DUF2254 domain-containing protein [Bacteriovoracia bacterium]
MKVRFALLLEKITTHFWLIPVAITISLIAFLYYLMQFEIVSRNLFIQELFFLEARPEAVRLLLSSIATSIMTVLGVVFSVIVLVIEQMSLQYTPRVVANFTRSKMAQVVLGVFVGTFAYCLILLMNIGQNNTAEDPIPRLAVAFAGILSIACLLFLILFIHHITTSIQSTQIIKDIYDETLSSLKNVIKDREHSHKESAIRTKAFPYCQILKATKVGYVDAVNWKQLSEKLKIPNWEIHFHKVPGDYIQKDMELLSVWSDKPIKDETIERLEKIIEISSSRTISQDPGYGIQKLSDIALKALSPGINDPSTAMEAIHSITTIMLEYLREAPIRNRVHLDENKVLIFIPMDTHLLLKKGYDHILRFSEQHEVVKDLVRQDLRFIQGRIPELELKHYLEDKISSIQLLH